jgi:hypothetical protein
MSATCTEHEQHSHVHGPDCGHVAVEHDGHVDYLHDGQAHHVHDGHVDECDGFDVHVVAGAHDHDAHEHGPDCGHETVQHGDHLDYLHGVHRHVKHGDHYDEH